MRRLSESSLDLVVVGGGAMGCALAWEAASRGLRIALFEQADFGNAVSANSLRIVHGGLRYLQKLDIGRARYSAGERSALLRIAPNLVRPLKCSVLTLPSLMRSRPVFAAGLLANALVTWDRNRGLDADRRLPSGGLSSLADYMAAADGIISDGATGAAYWYDGVLLDPWRLCLAFALSAEARGAHVRNHTVVERVETVDPSRSARVFVRDLLSDEAVELTASSVADCRSLAGASLFDPATIAPAADNMVVAVNVLLATQRVAHAVGFPGRDRDGQVVPGRLYFATPQSHGTALGTWYFGADSVSRDGSLEPRLIEHILAEINAATVWSLTARDIASVQIGRLPAKPASQLSEPEPAERPSVQRDPQAGAASVWQVQTEKWTTVRGVAESALDAIAEDAGLDATPSQTKITPLYGNETRDSDALRTELDHVLPAGCPVAVRQRIAARHGSNAPSIARRIAADPAMAETLPEASDLCLAEVDYAIAHERPRTLEDLMQRRLGLKDSSGELAAILAARMQATAG